MATDSTNNEAAEETVYELCNMYRILLVEDEADNELNIFLSDCRCICIPTENDAFGCESFEKLRMILQDNYGKEFHDMFMDWDLTK